MKAEQLENMIRDRNVPDDEVLKATREFLAERQVVEAAELDDVVSVGTLTERLRPEVYETLRKEVNAAHAGCCCGPEAMAEAETD